MPASTRKTSEPVQAAADGAKFVFFDLETTGLSPRGCRIIEMAALRVGPEGAIAGSFQALVRINHPVPYFITRLTGITNTMLARGERIESVFPRFCEFVGDLPLVAYNASFDMSFLRAEATRQNIKLQNKPVCALAVTRARVPGLSSYKLKLVAEHFGIEKRQTHRALDDCEMGLRVFSYALRMNRHPEARGAYAPSLEGPLSGGPAPQDDGQAASSAGPAQGITV
jgi:DNA polymerase III epsilon subunit family exonuclease